MAKRHSAAILGAAVLTLSLGATAMATTAPPNATPMLTPLAARDVVDACPGTERFAAALIRGATIAEATDARTAFAACAAQLRLPGFEWKTEAAKLALAGSELTVGLATNDAAAVQRAVDATKDLRTLSLATDDQIAEWRVIPDTFNSVSRRPITAGYTTYRVGDSLTPRPPFTTDQIIVTDAAYVNLAARRSDAWIHTVSES
jgi:hypothetical protein